jgi:hypothetical protein
MYFLSIAIIIFDTPVLALLSLRHVPLPAAAFLLLRGIWWVDVAALHSA